MNCSAFHKDHWKILFISQVELGSFRRDGSSQWDFGQNDVAQSDFNVIINK